MNPVIKNIGISVVVFVVLLLVVGALSRAGNNYDPAREEEQFYSAYMYGCESESTKYDTIPAAQAKSYCICTYDLYKEQAGGYKNIAKLYKSETGTQTTERLKPCLDKLREEL